MITGKARLAGVIGWPVGHSRSPRLHNHWLAESGIDGAYVPLPVPPGGLAEALRGLVALGFRGANVTVPHKEEAFAIVDRRDAAAEAIGAVNTLVVQDDGTIEGRNTDAHGFFAHLTAAAPQWHAQMPAIVLGAGGAARAVLFALRAAGVPEIRVVNRTLARAEALAAAFGPTIRPLPSWQEALSGLPGPALLVNTTSLGMTGQPPLEIQLDRLPADSIVYDLVYNPLRTDLIASAEARGLATVDGLGMLIHQARAGFAAWFGAEPPPVTADLPDLLLKG